MFKRYQFLFFFTFVVTMGLIVPVPFQKGGIDSWIWISIAGLTFLFVIGYARSLQPLPISEQILLPFILFVPWFLFVTVIVEGVYDNYVDGYERFTGGFITAYLINIGYYFSVTIPMIAVLKGYSLIRE